MAAVAVSHRLRVVYEMEPSHTDTGGGATGTTSDSALALVGAGNRSAAEAGGEDEQATGVSGRVLPDEFRAGLDAYFNRLEKERP